MDRRIVRVAVGAAAALLSAAFLPAAAGAVDQLYWSQYQTNQIAHADTDGSNGGTLGTAGSGISGPYGTAIDTQTGRIYFANYVNSTISFASLDGSGGGTLNTTGATVLAPRGLSIDPVARRIYWGNDGSQAIGWARLDGSGGDDFNRSGASPGQASSVAADPQSGRLWWASNGQPAHISFANLDGSGGGADLNTAGAPLNLPSGVAVDHPTGRIYWTNGGGGTIAYASTDGSGGGGSIQFDNEFPAGGLLGLAIDRAPGATGNDGSVYFAAYASSAINSSGLDGSNTGEVQMSGVSPAGPAYPVLLKVPAGAGRSQITGGPNVGSALSCSQGEWADGAPEASRFQSPTTYAYTWTLDGAPIAGATTDSITADSVGTYRCQVTGTNASGSATQESAPIVIASPDCPDVAVGAKKFKPRRLRFDVPRAPGVRARISVSEPSRVAIDGSLSWEDGARTRSADLGSLSQRNEGSRNMRFTLPSSIRDELPVGSKVTLKLSLVARPLDDSDCENPGTAKASLRTRVAIVLDK